MGRRNRTKNKARNCTTIRLKFLKRDGDDGLFINEQGEKFRAHKDHILHNLYWLTKNQNAQVKKNHLRHVISQRTVVVNMPAWFVNEAKTEPGDTSILRSQAEMGSKKKEPENEYLHKGNIKIVSTVAEVDRYKLPIGTQFHIISFQEKPKVGDYVMAMITSKSDAIGICESVDEDKGTCVVAGKTAKTRDIGYKIVNPDFLTKELVKS